MNILGAKKTIVAFLLSIVLFVSAGVAYFTDSIQQTYSRFFSQFVEPNPPDIKEKLEEIVQEIFSPEPLRSLTGDELHTLSAEKIISSTNRQRQENGITPLTENSALARAAKKKVEDMISKNYFAHDSPEGENAADFVKSEGYEHVIVGENLAMGAFADENDLVDAWMASPGHRANIVNPKYREIGVASARGTIDGQTATIAVQLFGLPASECPQVDETMRASIESFDTELKRQKDSIDTVKKDLDEAKKSEDKETYNARVKEYNELVSKYNSLLEKVKELVELYNQKVRAFNECAQKL